MNTSVQPTVIVGAGTAGISAAAQLAELGIPSIVLDEAPRLGGAVYRGPYREAIRLPHLDADLCKKIDDLRALYYQHQSLIDLRTNSCVLGPSGDSALIVKDSEKTYELQYQSLIIATGCHERSVPFPGWLLPGVMLMGGVQLQIKSGLVKPGHKMAVVGTGPLLPLIAVQLHKAGVNVVGVYEAGKLSQFAKEALHLLNRPQLMLQGVGLLTYLKQHQIPMHYGMGVVRADGNESLKQLTIAEYDDDWKPILHTQQVIDVDAAAVGYGFAARNQLSQLLGITHDRSLMSGLKPVVNEYYETDKGNTYVIGDSAGILGGEGAMAAGHIAAIDIARRSHSITTEQAVELSSPYQSLLNKVKKFRAAFDRIGRRRQGLLTLADADTVVCRCENVKLCQVEEAIEQGIKDVTGIKMRTRLGMGDCQGKTCNGYCQDKLKHQLNEEDVGYVRPRFPLEPIPFSSIVEGDES